MGGGEQLPPGQSFRVNFFQASINPVDKLQDDSHAEDGPISNAIDADLALNTDSDEWCVISDKD